MTNLLGIFCVLLLGVLSFFSVYQWGHAILAILHRSGAPDHSKTRTTRFLILIPAHNEEDGLQEALHSLLSVQYPRDLVKIVVIADRCADDTAKVARLGGARCCCSACREAISRCKLPVVRPRSRTQARNCPGNDTATCKGCKP